MFICSRSKINVCSSISAQKEYKKKTGTKISGCERIYESFLIELIAEHFLSSSATGIIQWLDLFGKCILTVVFLSYRSRVLRPATPTTLLRFLKKSGDVLKLLG